MLIRRCSVPLACVILPLLLSLPVSADMVLPSIVNLLSAPGPYSLMLIPAIITVPFLIVISLVEALIARRFLQKRSLLGLCFLLFLVNSVTSAIGLLVLPNGVELWPGIPMAFLATSVVESLFLIPLVDKNQRPIKIALLSSFAMNAGSYFFLTAILAAFIYLPSATCRNDLPESELTGAIMLTKDSDGDRSTARRLQFTRSTMKAAREDNFEVVVVNGQRLVVSKHTKKITGRVAPGLVFKGCWEVSRNGRYYANWVYGDAKKCVSPGDLVVGDCKTGKYRVFFAPNEYLFSPSDSKLAIMYDSRIVIYDPDSGRTKSFSVPYRSGESAWSPDGRFIAYLAELYPYTHYIGEPSTDAVRVISADDGRSITVYHYKQRESWWGIYWTP